MNTFSKKVRENIFKKYWYQCANFKDEKCNGNKNLSIHHIIHNTKMNIKIYGNDKIQSEENGILLCNHCHQHFGKFNKLRQDLINKWNTN